MKLPSIAQLIVCKSSNLRHALEVIDRAGQGVAFVVDETGKIAGILTDGDVRRALIGGVTLDSTVVHVMNREFVTRPVGTPDADINALLTTRIRHIPILDDNGRLVDYACRHRLHSTPVLEPVFGGNELTYLSECIKSGWISSKGRFIGEFERMFREFVGVPEAVAVSNGTTALHLALVALGIGPGDEVIVPDFTFGACANAVLQAGATPVFVDVEASTWGLSAETAAQALSDRTKAIMAVHLYGHPCDLDPLVHLCREKNLFLVEDCAEALGSKYKGRSVGSFGDAATFSFFGNKTVTTGEGGMILFKNPDNGARARMLRDHGMSPSRRYWHLEPGFNYRMTNLQAAIGVAQMERVGELVAAKCRVADAYRRRLSGVAEIAFPPEAAWVKNSYWLFTVLLSPSITARRDEIMLHLLSNGIETRPAFHPLAQMPAFVGRSRAVDRPIASALAARGLSLPSASSLSAEDQEHVCLSLESSLRALRLNNSPAAI